MGFIIRETQTPQDSESFISIEFKAAKENGLINSEATGDELFEEHKEELLRFIGSKPKTGIFFAESDQGVFLAEDRAGDFAGFVWAYVSQGDLGNTRYTWLWDLEVAPAYRGRGLGKQLLGWAERWTLEQGLDTIRTGIHAHNALALQLFRSSGYRKANLILQKRVT